MPSNVTEPLSLTRDSFVGPWRLQFQIPYTWMDGAEIAKPENDNINEVSLV